MFGEASVTPECVRLGLVATPIVGPDDVELLRRIRNACKDGFAHDNDEISVPQQEAWWKRMCSSVKGWLYWHGYKAVGYGLLRKTDDGRWWSSVAVLPESAGYGYGGAITADLIRRSDTRVWAEARLDNPAAMKLHRSADWEEWKRDERVAHYRTRYAGALDDMISEWSREGWVLT